MIANIIPSNFSSIIQSVDPLSHGRNSNVRAPLKRGAKPSLHVIYLFISKSDTLGVKVRSVPGTCIRKRSPSRISPSMPVTVELYLEKPFASVNRAHITSAFVRMLASTLHVIENVFFTCSNSISSMILFFKCFQSTKKIKNETSEKGKMVTSA
jgi:hypothetical protein